MSRWKIFSRSKEEKIQTIDETKKDQGEKPSEEPLNPENKPLADYHETLHTGKTNITKTATVISHKPSDQRIWRDVNAIEDNVDTIHLKKSEKTLSGIDNKVDELIEKTRHKHSKKPSNIIYVVSKPQPGEVKGDWAVRSHGKIYSHHKTKEKAIEEARKIAIKKDATVMIQNTDGTFSSEFKPRS